MEKVNRENKKERKISLFISILPNLDIVIHILSKLDVITIHLYYTDFYFDRPVLIVSFDNLRV